MVHTCSMFSSSYFPSLFSRPFPLRNLIPSSLQLSTSQACRQSVTGALSILRTLFESSAQTLFVQ